jgi:hypothetical protein
MIEIPFLRSLLEDLQVLQRRFIPVYDLSESFNSKTGMRLVGIESIFLHEQANSGEVVGLERPKQNSTPPIFTCK